MNEARAVAGLRSTLAFGEEAKLRLGDGVPGGNGGRMRRVVITEDRVCGVCFKRFGGSAIKVLPEWVSLIPLEGRGADRCSLVILSSIMGVRRDEGSVVVASVFPCSVVL